MARLTSRPSPISRTACAKVVSSRSLWPPLAHRLLSAWDRGLGARAARMMLIAPEYSDGQPVAGRGRRLVLTSIVGIPIVIGALVSVVLYSTRATPAPPAAPPPLPSPSATDTLVRDGQLLLLEPATLAPVAMLAGQKIEIVLNTGVGRRCPRWIRPNSRQCQSSLPPDAHLRRDRRKVVDIPGTAPRDDAAACDLRHG